MAVFVFYRIPLDFLQKEWMYRGVMLRIMSPGRFCLQGRAYRFHPVSLCLTLRFIYTRLPPLRAFRKLAKAGPVLHSYKWF